MENVFSHTAGTWAQGVVFESCAHCCLSVDFCCPPLLMEISEHNSFFEVLSPISFVAFLCCTMSAIR